jgi:4-carboxymuconolactone decarboxylase
VSASGVQERGGLEVCERRIVFQPIWLMPGAPRPRWNAFMVELGETLSRIALRDDGLINSVVRFEGAQLDQKTRALAQLGALIGLDGATPSFVASVQQAQAAGASEDEIVATLVAVIRSTGVARARSAAPKLALALGFQPDAALQENDRDSLNGPK